MPSDLERVHWSRPCFFSSPSPLLWTEDPDGPSNGIVVWCNWQTPCLSSSLDGGLVESTDCLFFYSGPTGHSVNTCWVNEEAKQQRTFWESECDVCVLLCASTWKILMMIFCIWLYLVCTDVNILFMLLYYNFAIDVTIGGNWVKHSETSLYFFL